MRRADVSDKIHQYFCLKSIFVLIVKWIFGGKIELSSVLCATHILRTFTLLICVNWTDGSLSLTRLIISFISKIENQNCLIVK